MTKNWLEFIESIHELLWKLPFQIHYTFLWLFSTKTIRLLDYSKEEMINFIEETKKIWEEEPDKIKNLDKVLSSRIRQKRFYETQGKEMLAQFKEDLQNMDISDTKHTNTREMIPIRRVVITPSSIEFKFFTKNMPNRVIRQYKNQSDDFIRVSFQGDDHNKGKYNHSSNSYLLHRIWLLMTNGFTVGRKPTYKTFKFLHYSNSQMKAHSCWFMNENSDLDYKALMNSLGNFEKEKKVSKNAARKGQAFSSAIWVGKLKLDEEIELIDDIERNTKTFSDGCGNIDYDFAK